MRKNHQAFTLVESLIVLFIVSSFILLPTVFFNRLQVKISEERYLSLFEKQLLYTQQMAIVKDQDTCIRLQGSKLLFIYDEKQDFQLDKIEGIDLSGPKKIVFKKGTGNNGRLAKYEFYWKRMRQLVTYQFQMGSGKYVKKITKL